uniref:Squamous cell carcinoma antigen recognized by T-cells 3 n=1 Tax=Caenorhabditis japonica TaxID=281687 RepID=A0A8R1IS02_CAEJA
MSSSEQSDASAPGTPVKSSSAGSSPASSPPQSEPKRKALLTDSSDESDHKPQPQRQFSVRLNTIKNSVLRDAPDLPKRIDQLISLYQRALRCATTQLEEIYQEAQLFCEEADQANQLADLKKLFEATMKQKRQLDEFEPLINDPKTQKQGLKQFLAFEKKSEMPARIQNAHERLVSELDDDEDVWCAYGDWTEKVLKLPQVSVEVYERALRHCPFSYVLHQQALLAFERAKRSEEVIDALWEKSKQNVINSADEGRGLYRTYVYLLRRRIVQSGSGDFTPMAEVFDEGAAILKEWFSMAWDTDTEYRRMQAYFYASVMKDMNRARQIWNDILASGFGRFAGKWLEAVQLERQFGDNENARKYLNKVRFKC